MKNQSEVKNSQIRRLEFRELRTWQVLQPEAPGSIAIEKGSAVKAPVKHLGLLCVIVVCVLPLTTIACKSNPDAPKSSSKVPTTRSSLEVQNHFLAADETTSFYYKFPLHEAISREDASAALTLIARGANVNELDAKGYTPLYLASESPQLESVVQSLIQHGALVDMTAPGGATPLHAACDLGSLSIVKMLIAHGANVNATTMNGETPLHVAVESATVGRIDVVEFLLSHGADRNRTNGNHMTPIMVVGQRALMITCRNG